MFYNFHHMSGSLFLFSSQSFMLKLSKNLAAFIPTKKGLLF
jgi:hypothetical protein